LQLQQAAATKVLQDLHNCSGRYAVIGCELKQNVNEGCNSCASLAGLVLCFIACFTLLVIASWVDQQNDKLKNSSTMRREERGKRCGPAQLSTDQGSLQRRETSLRSSEPAAARPGACHRSRSRRTGIIDAVEASPRQTLKNTEAKHVPSPQRRKRNEQDDSCMTTNFLALFQRRTDVVRHS